MSDSKSNDCPFCNIPRERILDGNAVAFAIQDAVPVSPGHTLIIPSRHIESFFELNVLWDIGRLIVRLGRP